MRPFKGQASKIYTDFPTDYQNHNHENSFNQIRLVQTRINPYFTHERTFQKSSCWFHLRLAYSTAGFLFMTDLFAIYVAHIPYLLFEIVQGQHGNYYYIINELYWNVFLLNKHFRSSIIWSHWHQSLKNEIQCFWQSRRKVVDS